MKYYIAILLILFLQENSRLQSFEGIISYEVNFEINEEKLADFGVTKEQIIEKMRVEGEYFDQIIIYMKNGNYVKEENSINKKRLIYKNQENLMYLFEEGRDYVIVMNGNMAGAFGQETETNKPQIEKLDSLKVIYGDTCSLLRLSWPGIIETSEDYWYSDTQLRINGESFKNHNYEYLNQILKITESYPMEISKSVGEIIRITMRVKEIEETIIDEELFEIPELKESRRKGDRLVKEMTGNKVMKIRN